VDHGKTSLLDAIRKADVASGEAGGITQHIGAYQVKLENGQLVTFIDTPGHAAFTAMRARGANVTDIVVLVVAADDGVMNQTIEAISHAKSAGVPIIVAVNKIDKPGAQPDRIKQQLTEYELVAEEWGGTTVFCPVSALKKTGIKELLEHILVQAEVMELKANVKRSGTGVVIESKMDRGRGIVATLLIKDGTVKLGQSICAGSTYGRVRAMFNDKGLPVKEAGPSEAVGLLGLNETPNAGDTFDVCESEEAAQSLAGHRKEAGSKATETPKAKVSLEELFAKVQTGDVKELPIVLKTDVTGSNEALKSMLEKASTDKVKIKIVHSAVGGVTESDVLLASSAKGLIIGFNVRPEPSAAALAKSQGVEIKAYSIIYEVIDDVKKAMEGLLAPTIVEKTLGHAAVRNTFSIPKVGMIAGCSVTDGKIHRTNMVRLIRDSRVIYDGKLSSLKRFKDDVKEVATGFECGIGIENYNDLKVGDVIEAYEKQQVAGIL
jgi:translation initiation factor IF-2